jgi:biotin transport system substrate-specific component
MYAKVSEMQRLIFFPVLRTFGQPEQGDRPDMSQTTQVSLKDFAITSDRSAAQVFWIITFAVLTAAGAQIEIPHVPVPYTLQTFFVLLAGGLLGKRNGFLAMSLYLAIGAVGFPVFSSGGFGLMKILGPTGGYLLAFPLAALLIGYGMNVRHSTLWTAVWMFLGLAVIFVFGTFQLALVTQQSWDEAFGSGFLIFSWWDLTKLIAATAIVGEFQRRISKTA